MSEKRLAEQGLIRVLYQAHVFAEGSRSVELPVGKNLKEIALELGFEKQLKDQGLSLAIYVEDVKIGKDRYADVIPLAGSIVTIKSIPADPVSVGTFILGGFGLTGAGTGFKIAAFVVGSIVTGAVSFGLSLLLGRLTARKQDELDGSGGGGSPALLIAGGINDIPQYRVVPKILGKWRYIPPKAAFTSVEVQGDVQYLNELFLIGQGDYQLSEFKLGETDLDDFEDVQYSITTTTGTADEIDLFLGGIIDVPVDITIEDKVGGSDNVDVTTTSDEVTKLQFQFHADNGLRRFNENAKSRPHSYQITAQYKKTTEGIYTTAHTRIIERETNVPFWYIITVSGLDPARYDARAFIDQIQPNNAYTRDRGGNGADASQLFTDLRWVRLKSFEGGTPVKIPGVTVFALRMRADEQLQGEIRDFNLLVESKHPELLSDLTFTTSGTVTRNPARIFMDILRDDDSNDGDPLPDSKLDLETLFDWQQFCVAEDFSFDMPVDTQSELPDILNTVARTGRGALSQVDNKVSVVFDDGEENRTQTFTPRNTIAGSFRLTRPFSKPVHAVRATFPNSEQGYRQDTTTIFNTGFDENTATKYVDFDRVVGITEYEKLVDFVRYELFSQRFRPEIITFDAPLEHVLCKKGDVVGLNNDIALIGLGSALVSSTTVDGNQDITGITIDDSFPMVSGISYGVDIRHNEDNTFQASPVDNPAGPGGATFRFSEITFPSPLASGTVAVNDLVAFGLVGSGVSNYKVVGIDPKEDLTATLTVVDTAPEIFVALTGTVVPPFTSDITRPFFGPEVTPPPTPEILNIRKEIVSFEAIAEGTPLVRMTIELEPGNSQDSSAAPTASYISQYRENYDDGTEGDWVTIPEVGVNSGKIDFTAFTSNTLDIRVWAVSPNRIRSSSFALVENENVVGDVLPPENLRFESTFSKDQLIFGPVLRVLWDKPFSFTTLDFIVRWNRDEGRYETAETAQTSFDINTARTGTYNVEVYTRDRTGEISLPASGTIDFDARAATPPLRVSGLELEGQGNLTEFFGQDAKFVWRINALNLVDPLDGGDFGDDADSGGVDPYFRNFQIRIFDEDDTLLRQETSLDPFYIYSFEKNAEDGGPRRDFIIEVRVRDINNQLSPPARLEVSNPAPLAPSDAIITFGSNATFVELVEGQSPRPTDHDKFIAWKGITQDFDLDDTSKVSESSTRFLSFPTTSGETFFLRFAQADKFSDSPDLLNISSAESVTVTTITISGTSGSTDTGFINPSCAANADLTGNDAWGNDPGDPGSQSNVFSSNNQYVRNSVGGGFPGDSDGLQAYCYGFSIPNDATILGIEASIERRVGAPPVGNAKDASVRLMKTQTAVGDNKAKSTIWTASDVTVTYGSSTDLWGESWAPADINNSGFGLQLQVDTTFELAEQVFVDNMKVRVFYSTSPEGTIIV